MLGSASVQEAHDFALIAQAAYLRSRIPVVHFFDGFRTSHEVNKPVALEEDDTKAMLPDELRGLFHWGRAPNPINLLSGYRTNPDVYFQGVKP